MTCTCKGQDWANCPEHDDRECTCCPPGLEVLEPPPVKGCPKHDCYPLAKWDERDEASLLARYPEFARSFTRKVWRSEDAVYTEHGPSPAGAAPGRETAAKPNP